MKLPFFDETVAGEAADVHRWLQRVRKTGANRVALIFETSLRCRLVREWALPEAPDFDALPAEMFDLATCVEAIQNAPEDRALLLAARDTELLPLVGSLTVQRRGASVEDAIVPPFPRPACGHCQQRGERYGLLVERLEEQIQASHGHADVLRVQIRTLHEDIMRLLRARYPEPA